MIVRLINVIVLTIVTPFAFIENRFYSFTHSVYCPLPLSSLVRLFIQVFVQLLHLTYNQLIWQIVHASEG